MKELSIIRKIIISPFLLLIFLYKNLLSPLLPAGCRHLPTCSEYASDALRMHGLVKGGKLAVSRILRCNPWGTHGFDPVPRFFFHKVDLKKYQETRYSGFPACDRLKH